MSTSAARLRARWALSAWWVGLALAACCGAQPGDRSNSDWQLRYRLSGGEAGYDVEFELDSTGRARYARHRPRPENRERQLTVEQTRAVRSFVEGSGMLDLGDRYRSSVPVEHPFQYELVWSSGPFEKRVVAEDGAELPRELIEVFTLIGMLQRQVLAGSAEHDGSEL